MAEAHLDGATIARVANLYHAWSHLRRATRKKAPITTQTLACVVGFHPALYHAQLHATLKSVLDRFSTEISLFIPKIDFKIAWKVTSPTFTIRLRKLAFAGWFVYIFWADLCLLCRLLPFGSGPHGHLNKVLFKRPFLYDLLSRQRASTMEVGWVRWRFEGGNFTPPSFLSHVAAYSFNTVFGSAYSAERLQRPRLGGKSTSHSQFLWAAHRYTFELWFTVGSKTRITLLWIHRGVPNTVAIALFGLLELPSIPLTPYPYGPLFLQPYS